MFQSPNIDSIDDIAIKEAIRSAHELSCLRGIHMLQGVDVHRPNAVSNVIQRPCDGERHQHSDRVDMLAADIIVFVEVASETMDDGDDGDEPSPKGAGVEAPLVPVWTAWMPVIQGRDVDISFPDNEVISDHDADERRKEDHV